MDVMQAVLERRSVRSFRREPIPGELVHKLKSALIQAPSAGNMQSRHFYFIWDGPTREKLAEAALGQDFIARAPLVVIGCTDRRISTRYGERGLNLYAIQDVAASVMSMMLAATAAGLGTTWVGAFHETVVYEVLRMPEHLRPVVMAPVGYPAKVPQPTPRVQEEDAVTEVAEAPMPGPAEVPARPARTARSARSARIMA